VVPQDVHWVMTAGWTFPGQRRGRLLKPLTYWLFRRVAKVYGFTTMPPMPPNPKESLARARAVRQVLEYAERANRPIIGLSPEGRDFPTGQLGTPPPGVG
jgi:hypothetical protein